MVSTWSGHTLRRIQAAAGAGDVAFASLIDVTRMTGLLDDVNK